MATTSFDQLPLNAGLAGTEIVPIDTPLGNGNFITGRTTTAAIANLAGSAGPAPVVLAQANALFPNARVLSGTVSDIVLADGGPQNNLTIDLAASAVTPGTYGSTSAIAQFTVDAKGRLQSAGNVSISGVYQPLSANLTSWAAITRASGFDTFTATPSSANLAGLLTDKTGTGSAVFAASPNLTTPNIGAANGTSLQLSGLTASQSVQTDASKNLISLANTGTGNNVLAVSPALTTPNIGAATAASLTLNGATSGSTLLQSTAIASGTLTLPAATDQLVGRATTDTFTNKTFDTAGAGNSFLINGLAATANTGTGAVARAVSPAFTTPNLGTPSAAVLTNATGLPVSTGITGLAANMASFLASGTSTTLRGALSDPTGTGSAVFANGPTLIAPALGTPVSGVATNLTGLPLTTGVTGVLPIANGGWNASSVGAGRLNFTLPVYVSSIAALQALNIAQDAVAVLTMSGRGGTFVFNSSNLSTNVTADPNQGIYVAPSSAPTGASGAWVRQYSGIPLVDWFGAVGDGATDDSGAIKAAIASCTIASLGLKTYAIASTIGLGTDSQNLIGIGRTGSIFGATDTIGSVLKWTGASGGTMVVLGSTTSGVDMHGGGISNIQIDANNLAYYGLIVKTIDSADIRNIKILNIANNSSAIALFLTAGTNAFAPINCVYRCSFENIIIQVSGAANGFYNSSPATTGGQNITFCTFTNISVEFVNGLGYYISAMDDCTFNNIATSRVSGGTGANIYLDGNAASGKGVFACVFNLVQPGVGSGTASVTAIGQYCRLNTMTISGVDGVPTIQISTGAELYYQYLGSGYTNTITAENPTFRQPPTQLASGLLSAPSAGLMEFDGTAFYGTSVASSRQVTTTKQITVLSTANTLSNSSTSAQNIFPTGQATLTLPATTTYRFRAKIALNTGATSHTTAFGLGGTATFTSVNYTAIAESSAAATLATPQAIRVTTASSTVLTAASTAVQTDIWLEGVIQINAAGTIIPQVTFSAGPTGTCQAAVGSYFEIEPIGTNTVTSVGNWS